MADHIHMVVSVPPKLPVAGLVGYIKGKSAIRIQVDRPDVLPRSWPVSQWTFACLRDPGILQRRHLSKAGRLIRCGALAVLMNRVD